MYRTVDVNQLTKICRQINCAAIKFFFFSQRDNNIIHYISEISPNSYSLSVRQNHRIARRTRVDMNNQIIQSANNFGEVFKQSCFYLDWKRERMRCFIIIFFLKIILDCMMLRGVLYLCVNQISAKKPIGDIFKCRLINEMVMKLN